MIEEISANLYKIEIPLPGSPLKSLNSYVIKGSERNLIVDTGWNQEECMNAMQQGLKEIGIDMRQTDFFITHVHVDHIGLLPGLTTDHSIIYFNRPDADRFKTGMPWDDLVGFARSNGYPEADLREIQGGLPGFRFRQRVNRDLPFHILKEGDTITAGDYFFRCIETPGHSRGHLCLYEPDKRIFVAGDHILNDITPNIQLMYDDWNPLKEYLRSLDKVYKLDIELVLPGHRSIIRNCKGRIRELKEHHRKRLDEVISILKNGSQNAFQVASQMTWDIIFDSWDLVPVSQKWFATGEAISHLKYLEEEGMVRKEARDGKIFFLRTA